MEMELSDLAGMAPQGAAPEGAPRGVECPWKLGAMVLVALVVTAMGFWLPGWIYGLVQDSVKIIGGAQ